MKFPDVKDWPEGDAFFDEEEEARIEEEKRNRPPRAVSDLPDNLSDLGYDSREFALWMADPEKGTRKNLRTRLKKQRMLPLGNMARSLRPRRPTPFL